MRDLSFYHYDALGSVAMTTGKNGQAIERYEYDVYGNAYDGWFSHNTHNDNPYGFTGQRYDRELGIYNFAYRDYNPHAMRWMTPDPVKDGMNWYGYVGSDPVNYVDPLGLAEEESQTWQHELEYANIDPEKISNMSRRNFEYIFEKVLAGGDGWMYFNGGREAVWCTAEDFERALDRQIELMLDPKYAEFDKFMIRAEKLTDGALQATGGYAQAGVGYSIATIGSVLILTVPAGIAVGVDGASQFSEGLGKMWDAVITPIDHDGFDHSLNPVRDWIFKPSLGEEFGENMYNYYSLIAALGAFYKSGYDLYKSGAVRDIVRRSQTAKAARLKVPLKTKVIQFGDKLIIHTVDATSNSSTPMITHKLIVDVEELIIQAKNFGIDVRNTNGTVNTIFGQD